MSADTIRTLVRKIGDVEVIVRLPIDMPDPFINLAVHRVYTTETQRAAAIDAFGMDEDGFEKGEDCSWFKKDVGKFGPGQLSATVFVESSPWKEAA